MLPAYHSIIACTATSDIDNSSIENKLAAQLRGDEELLNLVDVFYYEHHVMQQELLGPWGRSANGSIGESLEMMSEMRQKGVASHYWP